MRIWIRTSGAGMCNSIAFFLSTETSLEICKLHRNIGKTGATVLQAVTTSKSAFRIRIMGEASWIRLEEVQKYRLQTATQVEQQKYFPFFQKKKFCALCRYLSYNF